MSKTKKTAKLQSFLLGGDGIRTHGAISGRKMLETPMKCFGVLEISKEI